MFSWSICSTLIRGQGPVDEEAAHMVTISRSHTGEGGNVVEKYLDNHTVRFDGGAGFKSLLVLDGQAEAYIHVTAIKVKNCLNLTYHLHRAFPLWRLEVSCV